MLNQNDMLRIIKYISFSLAALLMVSGCKMGKNYSRPEMTAPLAFKYGQGDSTFIQALKWWDIFDDPTLDTLIAKALRNNYDVVATAHKVEAARLQLNIQKAELLPKIGYQGQAGRGNFNVIPTPDVSNNFAVFGQASWELDFWGKYRRLNESAKAQYLASDYGLSALKLSLISTVASTYFSLLEFREKEAISKSTYAIRDSSYLILKQRFEAGIIPQIDLNHSAIQRAIAATAIPSFRRLAAQTENALHLLIGENPGSLLTDKELEQIHLLPEIPAGIPADLLERRPDILAAEQQLIAQNALIGVAQANRLPSISLTGAAGLVSSDLGSLTSADPSWNITGSLLGPIFSWNQNVNRVKAERSRKEAAIANYKKVALNAFVEVEDVLIAIETLKQEELAIKDHVAAALSAMQLSSERYDKGIASYIEYLESQRQAFDAQMSLAGNRQKLLSAYIQLYQVLGGGWQ